LNPEPITAQGNGAGDIAAAILSAAADHHAALVVVGRRGLGRVKAAMLGSVSDTLVREAPLPVLVVPGHD
jgi:nucleotide-binding universal stress UspA family protein